jgi:exodeoxyribonuclease VII large subunit
MSETLTNMPEPFSVSELSQKLKRTLEQNFEYVRVRGELSKVKIHTSGHLYTDLKDENAVINAVCWRGTVGTLAVRPEEGLEVICTGKITTYPARSNYQLVIETMELAGQGALLKMLEDRRKKLEAEGLFDLKKKKPIPFLPERIGIITSPTGAVIQDILHRLGERFPRSVFLWPVAVQGANAVRDVTAAIAGLNNLVPHLRPDVLILARGGGSLEDLMPFNEEAIVRAIVASRIPIISAVGHETDTTLADYAADKRAPTPTAAAEMAVPVLADLLSTLNIHGQRLRHVMFSRLKHDRGDLRALQLSLGNPQDILNTLQQKLDFLGMQANRELRDVVNQNQKRFLQASAHLRHPKQYLESLVHRLTGLGQLLESYSFKNVLKRGFALVINEQDHVVGTQKEALQQNDLRLVFADGEIHVQRKS